MNTQINEIISRYCDHSPITPAIAEEYRDLDLIYTLIQHIPQIPFKVPDLLKYIEPNHEHESASQEGERKQKRPPNCYFIFMLVFKELLNRLVTGGNHNLDGKRRQTLGANFWNCLKKEYQEPYKNVAAIAGKGFPRMTYGRKRRNGRTKFKPTSNPSIPLTGSSTNSPFALVNNNVIPIPPVDNSSVNSAFLPTSDVGTSSLALESGHIISQAHFDQLPVVDDLVYVLELSAIGDMEPGIHMQFEDSPAEASQVSINNGFPPGETSIVGYNGVVDSINAPYGVIPYFFDDYSPEI
ncbi:1907_t:CDS:2 [Paraglomus occultum]|uniref:1907_t:CDS:1 n=1 Tax=Paraglomus occultum TaxID=144539 RepID=A0A9N8WNR0_9GLOM|nr:1907_t:CDS:2 [Paraglomus occultum]